MSDVLRNKRLAFHGHFYQPPRENPWTEGVDPEPSARPFRDWNARVAHECYGPNAAGPVLNPDGKIVDMSDNYGGISFNFGATLLSWLEREQPALYRRVLAHPENALAQPYYHAILPLQSGFERRLLIRWGLEDFKARFGRESAGLWLPETACDSATLEDLIDAGVRFTILHPRQAARVREPGGEWKEVTPKSLAPTRPYTWKSKLFPGKSITLFFFQQLLHESIVDGGAFKTPETLVKKAFARTHPDDSTQLIFTATDGEFFGHHHRRGAAALAQTLFLAREMGFAVTTPEAFLDLYPAPQEVEIVESSSWSCEHGLERWRSNCGCRSAHLPKWSQDWRGPLREALEWLARELDAVFEKNAGKFLKDYKLARWRYWRRVSWPRNAEAFLAEQALPGLTAEDRSDALALLELFRHRLAMFTSCGWFFDDVSGIETVQLLKHAARAVELAARFGAALEAPLRERLAKCASNVESIKDGAAAYEKLAKPSRVDHARLAAHWALLEHLRRGLGSVPPGWRVTAGPPALARKQGRGGRDRSLSATRLEVTSLATLETKAFMAVVHQKDRLDFACRLTAAGADASEAFAGFEFQDDNEFEGTLNTLHGAVFHTLEALLPEDRAEVLKWLTPDVVGGVKRKHFLEVWVGAVARLKAGAGDDDCLDLLKEAKDLKIPTDSLPWVSVLRDGLRESLEALVKGADEAKLSRAARWLDAFEDAGLHVDLWQLQELFWRWRAALAERSASAAERSLANAFGFRLGFAEAVLPMEKTA